MTRVELTEFNFGGEVKPNSKNKDGWMRMALVSPAGEITYNYRF